MVGRLGLGVEINPGQASRPGVGAHRDPELRVSVGEAAHVAKTRIRHDLGERAMAADAKRSFANYEATQPAVLLVTTRASRRLETLVHRSWSLPAVDSTWLPIWLWQDRHAESLTSAKAP